MKRARIVTRHEGPVNVMDIDSLLNGGGWHTIVVQLREDASKIAAEVGGYVDPDVPPLFTSPQLRQHVTFGGDWLLFAAEWTILVPDDFDAEEAARRDERKWKNT